MANVPTQEEVTALENKRREAMENVHYNRGFYDGYQKAIEDLRFSDNGKYSRIDAAIEDYFTANEAYLTASKAFEDANKG